MANNNNVQRPVETLKRLLDGVVSDPGAAKRCCIALQRSIVEVKKHAKKVAKEDGFAKVLQGRLKAALLDGQDSKQKKVLKKPLLAIVRSFSEYMVTENVDALLKRTEEFCATIGDAVPDRSYSDACELMSLHTSEILGIVSKQTSVMGGNFTDRLDAYFNLLDERARSI